MRASAGIHDINFDIILENCPLEEWWPMIIDLNQ